MGRLLPRRKRNPRMLLNQHRRAYSAHSAVGMEQEKRGGSAAAGVDAATESKRADAKSECRSASLAIASRVEGLLNPQRRTLKWFDQ